MEGYLNIADILKMEGKFSFTIDPIGGVLEIYVEASMSLDPIGSVGVIGLLRIDSQGLVAYIDVSMEAGFGGDIGLNFEASARLELNTSSTTRTFDKSGTIIQVQPGFLLHVEGSIEFLGFAKGSGYVDIQINASGIQMMFGVDFYLGGLTFGAHGGAGVYTGLDAEGNVVSTPGIALFLDVYVSASIAIVDIDASGRRSPPGRTVRRRPSLPRALLRRS